MPDILQQFPVFAPMEKVFEAVSTPAGLNAWWTQTAAGEPIEGAPYELGFGAGYDWEAVVSMCRPDTEFELTMTTADPDWTGSRVGFSLAEKTNHTVVEFHHSGWPAANDHYRISAYCWAMYLRLMRRFVESGETVPYSERLDA